MGHAKWACTLVLVLAGSGLPPSTDAWAQGDQTQADGRLIASLQLFIPQVLRQYGTPGLQIALARHGQVIWDEAFGYADLDQKTPMTPNTVFRTGSMGKTYTATAVMQLVEQGVLALDVPINRYLDPTATPAGRGGRTGARPSGRGGAPPARPAGRTPFQIVNPLGARPITVRDLMTHRSGLTSDAAGSELGPPRELGLFLRAQFHEKNLPSYQGTALPLWSAKVGERFQYSNLGLAVLGYLVEITNRERLPFSQYLQKHIFDVLDMPSTQFQALNDSAHLKPDIAARLGSGYAKLGAVDFPTPHIYLEEYPAGTSVTTPSDHIKLLLAYLNGGSLEGRQLLKPETVRQMLTPGPTPGMGLIWFLYNFGTPEFAFGHGGAYMFGWLNEFRASPTQDFAVVITTNHWDMMSPHYGVEPRLIAEFITAWLSNDKAGVHSVERSYSWAWKCSYVMGLVFIDQMHGGLGPKQQLAPAAVDAMVREARVRVPDQRGEPQWDEAGFRAAVEDVSAVPMRLDSLRAFLRSPRIRVPPEELPLLLEALGGQQNGIPWPEFVQSSKQ